MAKMIKIVGAVGAFSFGAQAVTIPLDSVSFGGGVRLTIKASPVGPDGQALEQQSLLLDTGSSTLAFCDSSLADGLDSLKTDYYSCNVYGSAQMHEGFWGPFYKGGVSIAGIANVQSSYYAVMKQQVKMTCGSSINGIFGIAFRQLDQGTAGEPPQWPEGEVGNCPNRPSAAFVQPLMQYLNDEGGVKQFGIYWSGREGEGEGKMFLDDDATSNSYYNKQQADAIGKAKLGEMGWYDITVESIDFNGQSFNDITCDPYHGSPCIMDTGTPVMVVPEDAYQAIAQAGSGTFSVKLQGVDGNPVELKFDVATFLKNQWIQPSPQAGVILGLPVRAFYYSVMDLTDSSIAFVPMPAYFPKLSNASAAIVV